MTAASGLAEDVAPGVHLESMGDRGQSEIGRNRVPIPFHERCTDFENPVAIQTDDLSLLGLVVPVGDVKLQVLADVDFPPESALGHDGERAIDRGPGDGFVDG